MLYSGVDEVGYGAFAGPIVAAACTMEIDLPPKRLTAFWPMSSVKDSKETTAAQREKLRRTLTQFLVDQYAFVGIGRASVEYINEHGYAAARQKALGDAVRGATKADGIRPRQLIVDGDVGIDGYPWRQRLEPKADSRFFVVAAASILAKITRDDMMVELGKLYPKYGFAQHKGYGTAAHIRALEVHGLTDAHRTQPCNKALRKRAGAARNSNVFRKTGSARTRRKR